MKETEGSHSSLPPPPLLQPPFLTFLAPFNSFVIHEVYRQSVHKYTSLSAVSPIHAANFQELKRKTFFLPKCHLGVTRTQFNLEGARAINKGFSR